MLPDIPGRWELLPPGGAESPQVPPERDGADPGGIDPFRAGFSQEMKSRPDPPVLGSSKVCDPSGTGTRWGDGGSPMDLGLSPVDGGVLPAAGWKSGNIPGGRRNSCLWGGETEARSHLRPAMRSFGGAQLLPAAELSINPTGRIPWASGRGSLTPRGTRGLFPIPKNRWEWESEGAGDGGRGSGAGFGEWERHPRICGKRVNREKDLVRRVVPGLFGVRERRGRGRGAGTPGIGNLRAGKRQSQGRDLGNWEFPGCTELTLPPSPAGRSGVT